MKRRNFLKFFSAIPLIGLPVKLLAKPEYPVITLADLKKATDTLDKQKVQEVTWTEDPYAEFDRIGYKMWFDGDKMNREWISATDFYKCPD